WRIHQARARFRPDGNFAAWARRIATNAALDHLRCSRNETELPEELPAAALPDPAIAGETRQCLRNAFEALPAKYRLVATLALIEAPGVRFPGVIRALPYHVCVLYC